MRQDVPAVVDNNAIGGDVIDVAMSGNNSAANSVNTPFSDEINNLVVDNARSTGTLTHSNNQPLPLASGQLDTGHTNYIDPSHWSSLLEEIHELREQLASPEDEQNQHQHQQQSAFAALSVADTSPSAGTLHTEDNETESTGKTPDDSYAGLVFSKSSLTLADLLKSLPPRSVCDRLISHYFRVGHAVLRELSFHCYHFDELSIANMNSCPSPYGVSERVRHFLGIPVTSLAALGRPSLWYSCRFGWSSQNGPHRRQRQ